MTEEKLKKQEGSKEATKTLELSSGNLDIRTVQALFNINDKLHKLAGTSAIIAETLKALNTRLELYYADCMKKEGK